MEGRGRRRACSDIYAQIQFSLVLLLMFGASFTTAVADPATGTSPSKLSSLAQIYDAGLRISSIGQERPLLWIIASMVATCAIAASIRHLLARGSAARQKEPQIGIVNCEQRREFAGGMLGIEKPNFGTFYNVEPMSLVLDAHARCRSP